MSFASLGPPQKRRNPRWIYLGLKVRSLCPLAAMDEVRSRFRLLAPIMDKRTTRPGRTPLRPGAIALVTEATGIRNKRLRAGRLEVEAIAEQPRYRRQLGRNAHVLFAAKAELIDVDFAPQWSSTSLNRRLSSRPPPGIWCVSPREARSYAGCQPSC
jgi:hypothetical protein